jgi:zinc and cadmium transporter
VERRPLGYLILLADGLHNLIGGLAVGGAFMVDIRVGIVTWLVAAAHEVPQELGDFGVLVHSGWQRRSALAWNFASALTFLVGALIAYAIADHVEVAYLLPFAAGNFVYIAAADLLPEITVRGTRPATSSRRPPRFVVGLAILLAVTQLA